MRERAARINAQLMIRSSGKGGTEIELCVPARTAIRCEPCGASDGRCGKQRSSDDWSPQIAQHRGNEFADGGMDVHRALNQRVGSLRIHHVEN
jgi:hypothetical protein